MKIDLALMDGNKSELIGATERGGRFHDLRAGVRQRSLGLGSTGGGLGWRDGRRMGESMPAASRRQAIGRIVRSDGADAIVTGGVALLSIYALTEAQSTGSKVVLGISTTILGALTVLKAIKALGV